MMQESLRDNGELDGMQRFMKDFLNDMSLPERDSSSLKQEGKRRAPMEVIDVDSDTEDGEDDVPNGGCDLPTPSNPVYATVKNRDEVLAPPSKKPRPLLHSLSSTVRDDKNRRKVSGDAQPGVGTSTTEWSCLVCTL